MPRARRSCAGARPIAGTARRPTRGAPALDRGPGPRAAGPALAEQVPALVERHLQVLHSLPLLVTQRLPRGVGAEQVVFLVHQGFDALQDQFGFHGRPPADCSRAHSARRCSGWSIASRCTSTLSSRSSYSVPHTVWATRGRHGNDITSPRCAPHVQGRGGSVEVRAWRSDSSRVRTREGNTPTAVPAGAASGRLRAGRAADRTGARARRGAPRRPASQTCA